MKLAISGKGGVGKSTLAAGLCLLLAERGDRVLAIDADPDANLASALGIDAEAQKTIIPISQQRDLVEQRTGAKANQYGQIFKLNPDVSDLADKIAYVHNGVALLVLGAVTNGGGGCACPESVLLRALVSDVVLYKDDALVLDMEAGVEHLGRATARGVDTMLIVVEPGQRSLDCAARVHRMAEEIGLADIKVVANKVTGPEDEQFIRDGLDGLELAGVIPYFPTLRACDRDGMSVLDSPQARSSFEAILDDVSPR